jgi:predicted RNase H-like HicB family nuclease
MTYEVMIHRGPNSVGASVPDLPGVFAVGESIEEVRELIAGAMDLHIRALIADGETVPEPTHAEIVEVAVAG